MQFVLLKGMPLPVMFGLFAFVVLVVLLLIALPRLLRTMREHRVAAAEDRAKIAGARHREISATFEPLGTTEDEPGGGKRKARERVPRE